MSIVQFHCWPTQYLLVKLLTHTICITLTDFTQIPNYLFCCLGFTKWDSWHVLITLQSFINSLILIWTIKIIKSKHIQPYHFFVRLHHNTIQNVLFVLNIVWLIILQLKVKLVCGKRPKQKCNDPPRTIQEYP